MATARRLLEILAREMPGRVVKDWSNGGSIDDQLVITFDDNTFVCFRASYDYHSDSVSISPKPLQEDTFWVDELVRLGFYSQEEMDRRIEERKAEAESRSKALRRERYLKLKAEFEPEVSGG